MHRGGNVSNLGCIIISRERLLIQHQIEIRTCLVLKPRIYIRIARENNYWYEKNQVLLMQIL